MTGINRFRAPPIEQTLTQIASGGRPGPRIGRQIIQADEKTIKGRWRKGACLYYRKKGYFIRNCNLLLAQKPIYI